MKRPWLRNAALVILLLVIVVLGAAGGVLWRGVPFPALTGPYLVGRTQFHLIDTSRPEIFSDDPNDVREVMVYVHYPAEPDAKEPRAPYADRQLAAGISAAFDTPQFVAASLHSHALDRPRCRAQEGGYPVLIFSPGFGQPPLFYTATLEDLASHGFVVVSVYHPYSNGVTVFPERVVMQNEAGSQTDASLGYDALDKGTGAPVAAPEQKNEDVGAVWVRDVQFVLGELERLNRDDALLAGRLDMSRVGIFGHSFGGATAVRTVQIDPRFRAGINMDGTDFRATNDGGTIDRPCLWFSTPPHDITDAQIAAGGMTRAWVDEVMRTHRDRTDKLLRSTSGGARAMVRGAAHQTFTSDFALLGATRPWSWLLKGLDLGTIEGRRAVALVNTLVLDFFRLHLQGDAESLQNAAKEYPEIELMFNKW